MERKSRDQWIREQQMKIENFNSMVSLSDCERNGSQVGTSKAFLVFVSAISDSITVWWELGRGVFRFFFFSHLS